MAFEELVNFISNENTEDILGFWKNLTKKGLPEDLLFHNLELFSNIWNYFPHKCLKNKSPYEMSKD